MQVSDEDDCCYRCAGVAGLSFVMIMSLEVRVSMTQEMTSGVSSTSCSSCYSPSIKLTVYNQLLSNGIAGMLCLEESSECTGPELAAVARVHRERQWGDPACW